MECKAVKMLAYTLGVSLCFVSSNLPQLKTVVSDDNLKNANPKYICLFKEDCIVA
jgi:hypothetical protein